VERRALDSSVSGYGTVVGSYEHDNLCFHKRWRICISKNWRSGI